MRNKTCRNCHYFDNGYCRRYPPQVSVEIEGDGAGLLSHECASWPITSGHDWCGEFTDRTGAHSG